MKYIISLIIIISPCDIFAKISLYSKPDFSIFETCTVYGEFIKFNGQGEIVVKIKSKSGSKGVHKETFAVSENIKYLNKKGLLVDPIVLMAGLSVKLTPKYSDNCFFIKKSRVETVKIQQTIRSDLSNHRLVHGDPDYVWCSIPYKTTDYDVDIDEHKERLLNNLVRFKYRLESMIRNLGPNDSLLLPVYYELFLIYRDLRDLKHQTAILLSALNIIEKGGLINKTPMERHIWLSRVYVGLAFAYQKMEKHNEYINSLFYFKKSIKTYKVLIKLSNKKYKKISYKAMVSYYHKQILRIYNKIDYSIWTRKKTISDVNNLRMLVKVEQEWKLKKRLYRKEHSSHGGC